MKIFALLAVVLLVLTLGACALTAWSGRLDRRDAMLAAQGVAVPGCIGSVAC